MYIEQKTIRIFYLQIYMIFVSDILGAWTNFHKHWNGNMRGICLWHNLKDIYGINSHSNMTWAHEKCHTKIKFVNKSMTNFDPKISVEM